MDTELLLSIFELCNYLIIFIAFSGGFFLGKKLR